MPQRKTVEVIEAAPDRLDVRGALTFATARVAYEAGLRALRKRSGASLSVDCAQVTESDSAGLAVLIEWLAAANRIKCTLRFANLPEGIRAAAQISEVTSLLGSAA
ncbi:MAG TPA: STAS domain-containing protein [Steroidobacteraceae bacterium]|nr:STAS domain-containing protein [Steroidobacteraceae bacterium]